LGGLVFKHDRIESIYLESLLRLSDIYITVLVDEFAFNSISTYLNYHMQIEIENM
jgi:hypothetical protein